MIKLKEELIKGLKIIPESNRDLRTITIYCNPNFIRGSDESVRGELGKILMELENKNKVIQEKKKFNRTVKTIYRLA